MPGKESYLVGDDHPHQRAHDHDAHAPAGEDYAARKHPEFVVLEIGEDIGALVIHTDASMHGVEIEISREGAERDGSHKQVLERNAGGQAQFTAVFDGLAAGSYALWTEAGAREHDVKVAGGRVTELDWRTA